MRKLMSGTKAVAEAIKLLDVDVAAGYPIRPYTAVMNYVTEHIGNGDLDADFFWADSEHSQFEICKHASLTGARVFTGSSGVGWAQGFEPLVIIPTLRLPVVLMLGNRSFDDPGTFGVEWNDAFTSRDLGYLMCWPESPQEAFDFTLMAYRISENKEVYLPSIVNIEGGVLTHVEYPVEVPSKKEISEYVPPLELEFRLHPDRPMTYAAQVDSEGLMVLCEMRKQADEAMKNARRVTVEAHQEFYQKWGRQEDPYFDEYYADDAEVVVLTMGTMAWGMRPVIRELRKEGKKVGYVRLKRFRPFPDQKLKEKLSKYRVVGVCDREVSLGAPKDGGVVFQEVRSSLYEAPNRPLLVNFYAGLGGREVNPPAAREMYESLLKIAKTDKVEEAIQWIGLRR
jgi:pyruvate/2-oxoacid:ferredoxin oxidoreductase alpha subunit